MEHKVLYRHSAPTKLDTADIGTIVLATYLKDKDIYLQVSSNSEEPRWEFIMNVPLLTSELHVEEIVTKRLTETLETLNGKL